MTPTSLTHQPTKISLFEMRNPMQTLFDIPIPKTRQDQILERFAEYHKANPHIFRLFCRFAEQVADAGFEHYSARGIFHRIRWHTDVETRSDREGFKLSNYHSPYYARMYEIATGRHGFFRNRECRSASASASDSEITTRLPDEAHPSESVRVFLERLIEGEGRDGTIPVSI